MLIKSTQWKQLFNNSCASGTRGFSSSNRGQALVEFTLVFILLIIVTWIPAEFGLAFYAGQLAQNASREGARIAAAERNLPAMPVSCVVPCSGATNLLQVTANRIGWMPLSNATITLSTTGVACNQQVNMQITGTYHFFFYEILKLIKTGGNLATANVTRQASMRWEHQC